MGSPGTGGLLRLRSPLSFDFEIQNRALDEPSSHVHINRAGPRIPVHAALSLNSTQSHSRNSRQTSAIRSIFTGRWGAAASRLPARSIETQILRHASLRLFPRAVLRSAVHSLREGSGHGGYSLHSTGPAPIIPPIAAPENPALPRRSNLALPAPKRQAFGARA